MRSGNGRKRDERGFTMLIVITLGLLMAAGITTAWFIHQHARKAGDQRRDFQTIHAAEAGVKFYQNRLNNLVLCHAWFTYQDSLNVVGLLRDTTIALPSPYGSGRGFRIRGAQVVPNISPLRVRFESVGGRILGGGVFDSSDGHPILCEMRMRTLADFVLFGESGTMTIGTGAVIKGRLYRGGDVLARTGAILQKLVSLTGTLTLEGTAVAMQGYEILTNPLNLAHIHGSASEPKAACAGSLPKSYEELAKGQVPNEKTGFAHAPALAPHAFLLDLDDVTVSGGNVQLRLYAFDATKASLKNPSSPVFNGSMPLDNFNGVVFVDGDVMVKGTLSDVSLTVVSNDDVMAVGDVLCSGKESNSDRRVTLGLMAQHKFLIWAKTQTRLTVEAAIVAEDDSLFSYGYEDPLITLSWVAQGDVNTHVGVDAAGNPANVSDPANWVLNMRGAIIAKGSGGAPNYNWSMPGATRNYESDPDLIFSPPPKFSLMHGDAAGIPMWEVAGWGEQ